MAYPAIQATTNRSGMKIRSLADWVPGIFATTTTIEPTTTASPTPAFRSSRRLPSKKAAANPTTPRLPTNGISSPFTYVSPAAISQ